MSNASVLQKQLLYFDASSIMKTSALAVNLMKDTIDDNQLKRTFTLNIHFRRLAVRKKSSRVKLPYLLESKTHFPLRTHLFGYVFQSNAKTTRYTVNSR